MSLAGWSQMPRGVPGLIFGGELYSEVQYIMGNGHMPPPNRDTCENITFPQLHWQAVKTERNENKYHENKQSAKVNKQGSTEIHIYCMFMRVTFHYRIRLTTASRYSIGTY